LVSAPAPPPVLPRPVDADEGLGADEFPGTTLGAVDGDDPEEVAAGPVAGENDLDLNEGLGWSWEYLGPALVWTVIGLVLFGLTVVAAKRWRRLPSYAIAALPLAVVMFLAFEQIDKILPAI